MARDYSNKVTLRPAPGTVGPPGVSPIDIIVVDADPSGVIAANAGSLALLAGGTASWRSQGGTTWTQSSPGAWVEMVLINGWAWLGAGTYKPACRFSGTGNVELRGAAFNPAAIPAAGEMFVLPAAFRSPNDTMSAVGYFDNALGNEKPGTVTIFSANGFVRPDTPAGAGSSVYLDGISYSIDPEV